MTMYCAMRALVWRALARQSALPGRRCRVLVFSALAAALAAVVGAGLVHAAPCQPLPPPTGPTVTVSTVAELIGAVDGATPGSTILLSDGIYDLDGAYLRIAVPNVTLRSASGDRDSVVLDGNYVTTEIIQVVASSVTIADLTLRQAFDHPIHVMSTDHSHTLDTLIYNVHIIDPGQQAIKINPAVATNGSYFPDAGVIACSHIELTDEGRPHIRDNCYTGGIDGHQARDWVIRDNLIEGFWCPNGLSEHGIHLWRACRDTVVERNELRNNARGIGFGLATAGSGMRTYPDNPCPAAGGGYVDHYGGVIRNNFVYANDSRLFESQYGFDCGICLWNACRARVLHNTVASTRAPFSSIEWRFDNTDVDVVNNLLSHNIMDRGGSASLGGNLEQQPLSLFVDGDNGDLHLAPSASVAIDQVSTLSDAADDFDGDPRPQGSAADIGADELAAVPTSRPTATRTPQQTPTAPQPTPTGSAPSPTAAQPTQTAPSSSTATATPQPTPSPAVTQTPTGTPTPSQNPTPTSSGTGTTVHLPVVLAHRFAPSPSGAGPGTTHQAP